MHEIFTPELVRHRQDAIARDAQASHLARLARPPRRAGKEPIARVVRFRLAAALHQRRALASARSAAASARHSHTARA